MTTLGCHRRGVQHSRTFVVQCVGVMRRVPFAFENLAPPTDPFRGPAIVGRELRAIANNVNRDPDRPHPKVIGLCEAIGHRLPTLDGYGDAYRSLKTRGRANLALYVRDGLDVAVRWHDLARTWPRTETTGTHPARSILEARVEDWTVIVGHAPPLGRGTAAAREEWLAAMVELLGDDRGTVLALTDPNGLGAELARKTGATHGGTGTDAVHGRGIVLDAVLTPHAVNGVPMLTDHRCCLLGRSRVRS